MSKPSQPETSRDETIRHQKRAEQKDAKGQFAPAQGKPNDGGLASSNPTVLSGNGDATFKGDPHADKADPEKNEP